VLLQNEATSDSAKTAILLHIFPLHKTGERRLFAKTGGKPLGGRPTIEYAVSLDMAKELAMVEGNEREPR
jgi:hypothetical protein